MVKLWDFWNSGIISISLATIEFLHYKAIYLLKIKEENVQGNFMKAVILAGGLGTRLREETEFLPKPMVPIGDKPILWHIMKIYSSFGYNDFIFCLGYKGYIIKEYFANYCLHKSDVTIDLKDNSISTFLRLIL